MHMFLMFDLTSNRSIANVLSVAEHTASTRAVRDGDQRGGGEGIPAVGSGAARRGGGNREERRRYGREVGRVGGEA